MKKTILNISVCLAIGLSTGMANAESSSHCAKSDPSSSDQLGSDCGVVPLSPREQIAKYLEENKNVFDFRIDDKGRIRIERYYDREKRTHIKIPDFVYGFACKKNGYNRQAIFPHLKYLKSIELGSGIRDLSWMFYDSSSAALDLSQWDVSKVTDMSSMFSYSKLESVGDLSHWDVSKVEYMDGMFAVSQLQSVGDLSHWDISKMKDMCSMFAASQLQSVGDLSQWDVSKVTGMYSMFFGSKLQAIGDLSQWDVSMVTGMECMFTGSQLKTVGDLSQWDVSKVTDMSFMFWNSQLKSVGDLSQWDVSKVADMKSMFAESKLKMPPSWR